ncbi:NIPSNAP family protein [Kitasatospora mediocidica]|uniref:NIPSNAP family protein n=1 Tax=Kitasatospora mediocidica TaxID=58352 RepID=UPI0007C69E8F|nr:NIPSNAP family protein [Kitasatospora mediocidica]
MSIVELRQYTLRPGARDTLISLFERKFVTGQEVAGITLGSRFRDVNDPDRFVWLRAFPDMAARARALSAFYYGPVWQAHRDEANATMIDSDNVLLLNGPGFTALPDTETVTLTICHPRQPDFAEYFTQQVSPALAAADVAPLGVHHSEHAENNFPALPVRTGEDVFLWFTAGTVAPDLPWPDGLLPRLHTAPQQLHLEPIRWKR